MPSHEKLLGLAVMSHQERRLVVKQNMSMFVQQTFVPMIQTEMAKWDKYTIEFQFDDSKWSITTSVNIKYSAQGSYQHDDKEVITHIETTGKIVVDNQLAGDFTIKYQPGIGFINLTDCVLTAINSIDLFNLDEQHSEGSDGFMIQNILEENIKNTDESAPDPRIVELVGRLTGMNYQKKRAQKLAERIVRDFSDVHDMDSLVEEALNALDSVAQP
ncbi:MAG: hypothetical protein ACTSW7_01595 [Candidatus Thorarchaeota archaeon]|nr:hypothetical protein [Thermoplasmatales archaeon]